MKKYSFLEKIEFDNYEKHIEIFCRKRYKDYFIRGQVFPIPDLIYIPRKNYFPFHNENDIDCGIQYWDEEGKEIKSFPYYTIIVFTLVNKHYQIKIEKEMLENKIVNPEYKFVSNTLKNYKGQMKHHRRVPNKSILIEENEINITENDYLKKCINEGQEIILYSIDFNVPDYYLNKTKKNNYYDFIYPKIIDNCLDNFIDGPPPSYQLNYLYHFISSILPDEILNNFQNLSIDYREYNKIINKIGNISYAWENKLTDIKDFIIMLNKFSQTYEKNEDPLVKFLYKIFSIMVDKLNTENKLRRCLYCYDYFPIDAKRKSKKYCSTKFEGKDCGKNARNKRSYEKNKTTRLPKARKTTRELREWYREKGIKK